MWIIIYYSSAQAIGSGYWAESWERQKCSRNKTVFDNRTTTDCYYDHACFEVFSDCCPNYRKKCGRQESKGSKWSASIWKCIESFDPIQPCKAFGVWMIYKCPASVDTSFDKLRAKCENAPSEFSYPVENYIPVVGTNSLTYRNKHCALCNGVKNYISWDVRVLTYVVPPEHFDLDSKLKFITENGSEVGPVVLGEQQPRRFCYGRNYIDNCTSTNHTSYKACIEGPVEVVTGPDVTYFKNIECAACNGYPNLFYFWSGLDCDEGPSPYSLVFKLNSVEPKTTVVSKECPRGTVFDDTLKFCREGYIISSSGKPTNEFLILLWLKQSFDRKIMNSTQENDVKSALSLGLSSRFLLSLNQISMITFHRQYEGNEYLVATFRLTLTPFQSLIMTNEYNSDLNITRKDTAFFALLNFTRNFTIVWKEYSIPVVNVVSKQLSCFGEKKFPPHEYKIDWENGSLMVNKTGEVLSLSDYSLLEHTGGNITLCRKVILSDCKEGAFVPLRSDEYVIFQNLTVYHKATNSIFKFGEYLMSENLNNGKNAISNTTQDSTIAVCLPFKKTFNETEKKYSASTTSYGLQILTLIGFSISTVCHILLLVTYGLFQELRTVPGLNLMNLSFSMLLSQVIWLVGTAHFEGTVVCEVLAILEHYLLQVSFLAMSIISYHTCLVFSQPIVGRTANTSRGRFIKYSAFVWLSPAIFVAICVTLDKTETLLVDYGTNCWWGTANAKLYLFLLPLAVLLLYNIYKFIRTAVSLSRHNKIRTTLQRKEGKQNLLICAKLATLVGFPWLFAFLGVLFPDVEAFEYLFVVFVCLQGLYIGMAFLFNEKTLKRYRDRWNIGARRNTPHTSTKQRFEMRTM